MDTIPPDLAFEDTSAHTTSRKSARSGQVEVLVRAVRRRPWTPEQKCQIVSESLEAGATPADVARRHGIGTGQLYTWRRQMMGVQSAVSTKSGPRFAPVELSPAPIQPDRAPISAALDASPAPACADGLIEIMLPGGVSLRVDAHVDGRALRRVLGVLEGR